MTVQGKERRREYGAGGKPALATMEDQLLFVLLYFRTYPTQDLLGVLFGQTQPWANKWVHRMTPILRAALGYEMQLPARPACTMEELVARCPGLEFIIDATERPIVRPHEEPRQREHYSGKKKRHTLKNTVVTDRRTKKVAYLGSTAAGTKHDKRLADDDSIPFPPGSVVYKDTGYQGFEPQGVTTYQPKKKPRGGSLSDAEKESNRAVSRIRIAVEHSIGGAKIFRIVHDTYRNHKVNFDDTVMEVSCGLYNYIVDGRRAA